jgi:uncharacterized membrane protein
MYVCMYVCMYIYIYIYVYTYICIYIHTYIERERERENRERVRQVTKVESKNVHFIFLYSFASYILYFSIRLPLPPRGVKKYHRILQHVQPFRGIRL